MCSRDSLKFGQELAKTLDQPVLTDAAELTDLPSESFSALVLPDGSTFLVVEDVDDDGHIIILEDTIRPAERIR